MAHLSAPRDEFSTLPERALIPYRSLDIKLCGDNPSNEMVDVDGQSRLEKWPDGKLLGPNRNLNCKERGVREVVSPAQPKLKVLHLEQHSTWEIAR